MDFGSLPAFLTERPGESLGITFPLRGGEIPALDGTCGCVRPFRAYARLRMCDTPNDDRTYYLTLSLREGLPLPGDQEYDIKSEGG